jgi:uncharacterized membrane protein
VDGTVGAIYGALVGIIFLIPFGGRGRVVR